MSTLPSSNVDHIFETFHGLIRRIEALERRVNERAVRTRRRLASLLDARRSTHRHSHLRLFLTHAYNDINMTDAMQQQTVRREWRLQIEGRLLVGHLDHQSAVDYDEKTGYVPPNDDLDRAKGEQEEDKPNPIHFSHFFERISVEFQPLFQPKPHPMSKKVTPKKSSRRGSTSKSPTSSVLEDEVDPATLVMTDSTELVWTRNLSEDAHAVCFRYTPPAAPGHHLMPHSIVAKAKLYSRKPEDLYQPSKELGEALFKSHLPEAPMGLKGKKKKEDVPVGENPPPPRPLLDNEIHIPQGLTMREVCAAFFTYIQDRDLSDEADKSVIRCDAKLQALFGLDRFPFHQLQHILMSRQLLRKITHEPVELVYILKPETATPSSPELESNERPPAILQLDMDIAVPALFPFRTRELLRRVKRRELEYTSSRTKARYVLMARRAKSEDAVKNLIDQAVTGHSLEEDLQPVWAALSKSAPPNTEARMAAHYDARMSYLLGRLKEHQQGALEAWALADACDKKASDDSSPKVQDDDRMDTS